MFHLLGQNIIMAMQELFSNKLRAFLSLLGITIGVFCIISVLTVFDSLQRNIQNNMQTLGSDVLYIGKFAWIPEDKGEYPWWKYKVRPVCNLKELKAIQKNVSTSSYSALLYADDRFNVKYESDHLDNVNVFAVTYQFNKLQAIDIENGRYFSMSEMEGGHSNGVLIGSTVADELFGNRINPIGKQIEFASRKFNVIGVMKKQGKTMTGFDFDNGMIVSYTYFSSFRNIDNNIGNGFVDPMLLVKTRQGFTLDEMRYEIKSVLRAMRKLKPKEPDNFAFNQLDSIQNSINDIFLNFNIFGWIIGLFSLLVGGFGIANIMFVSVKERRRLIGVKKAIGAQSQDILIEFLIESIILCLMGGLFGIVFVFLLSKLLSGPLGFPVIISSSNFILGISLSVVVGILSGIIPAVTASKMNPVDAIRS
jgi:putative ABC transport system permease protein